jgi:hypothetical protein
MPGGACQAVPVQGLAEEGSTSTLSGAQMQLRTQQQPGRCGVGTLGNREPAKGLADPHKQGLLKVEQGIDTAETRQNTKFKSKQCKSKQHNQDMSVLEPTVSTAAAAHF